VTTLSTAPLALSTAPSADPPVSGRRASPTLEDVAAAAGVSRSTASRAINGGSRVSADALAAVEAAVLRLGFSPNRAARNLVTHRADSVALVVPEPDERVTGDPFFAAAIRGLSQAMGDTDLQLVLLMARVGDSAERTIRYLRLGYVDGVVVVSHHRSDEIERALLAASLPSVFVGRPWNMPDRFSYVDTDNERGAEVATEHLLSRGRRRVGTVAGPPDMTSAQDRLAGCRSALTKRGLPADAYEHGDFTTPGGLAATERLLDKNPDLDAIFVASDLMAVGALAVLKARGLAVPADVAVVGYDDAAVAAATDPPLTTVVNPIVDMARTAGVILLERMSGDRAPVPPTMFAPELVVRLSS